MKNEECREGQKILSSVRKNRSSNKQEEMGLEVGKQKLKTASPRRLEKLMTMNPLMITSWMM